VPAIRSRRLVFANRACARSIAPRPTVTHKESSFGEEKIRTSRLLRIGWHLNRVLAGNLLVVCFARQSVAGFILDLQKEFGVQNAQT
jgi:hypothetical protein